MTRAAAHQLAARQMLREMSRVPTHSVLAGLVPRWARAVRMRRQPSRREQLSSFHEG